MRNKKTWLITICTAVLLMAVTVGTLAFLTDRDEVKNTFTVGDVQIKLDETKVENGVATNERTTDGNNYHLIPGKTYVKDPTVTVLQGSEEAYVRMLVTVSNRAALDEIFETHELVLTDIFKNFNAAWVLTDTDRSGADTIVYEFRYETTVTAKDAEAKLPALFTEIAVPGEVTRDEMQSIAGLSITVVGEAIQAETFDSADAAWAAFDKQVNQ